MLKMIGGILGILGGLGGLAGAALTVLFLLGSDAGMPTAVGLGVAATALIGGACAIACVGLGIAILMSGGRLAGVLMIVPALLGMIFTYGGTLLAIPGAFLAAFFGETAPKEESYETRKSRLEKEVQQRYGARG
jgi:hypothetical protein